LWLKRREEQQSERLKHTHPNHPPYTPNTCAITILPHDPKRALTELVAEPRHAAAQRLVLLGLRVPHRQQEGGEPPDLAPLAPPRADGDAVERVCQALKVVPLGVGRGWGGVELFGCMLLLVVELLVLQESGLLVGCQSVLD